MSNWDKFLIRFFGILHLAFGAIGIVFLIDAAVRTIPARSLQHFPYERLFYHLDLSIEAILIGGLIWAGVQLTCLQRRGVSLSNYVLTIEMIYWVVSAWTALALAMHGGSAKAAGMSIAAVAGIGGMPTAPQLLTGYPLIALVALNLARRHLDRSDCWPEPVRGGAL